MDHRFALGFRRWWPYYLMMAPGLIFFLIWHYFPIWEAKMAFEQVRIIPPNIWVGLKHFQTLFSSPVFYTVLANTLIISAMKIIFVFPIRSSSPCCSTRSAPVVCASSSSPPSTSRTSSAGW